MLENELIYILKNIFMNSCFKINKILWEKFEDIVLETRRLWLSNRQMAKKKRGSNLLGKRKLFKFQIFNSCIFFGAFMLLIR